MLSIPPPIFRKRRGRIKAKAAPPAPPINMIDTVFIEEDDHTIDVLFTAGTEVTAVDEPGGFIVNDPGGQKAASDVDIVGPSHVRFVFSPHVNFPATWEVNSPDLFTFASGAFAGPNSGDVIFPE
jgi:hypothetical protein